MSLPGRSCCADRYTAALKKQKGHALRGLFVIVLVTIVCPYFETIDGPTPVFQLLYGMYALTMPINIAPSLEAHDSVLAT